MVTLHLLQYLKENGFGTEINDDLFFEKLPLGKVGVAIYSRGGEATYGRSRLTQNFDLYCRGVSDLSGADTLEKIRIFFTDNYDNLCELPIVPDVSNRVYKKARITAIGNVENVSLDANDRIIFRLTAQIIYEKEG